MGRSCLWISIVCCCLTQTAEAQEAGFQFPAKLGLGMSRNFVVDAGLASFSYIPKAGSARYYDALLDVAVLIGKHTMLLPKVELNAGILPVGSDAFFVLNIGAETGVLTDFKQAALMLSPKAGVSVGQGLFRLHYLRNILAGNTVFPGFGSNTVQLEINIASLQGRKVKGGGK